MNTDKRGEPMEAKHKDLTKKIVGAFFTVYNILMTVCVPL